MKYIFLIEMFAAYKLNTVILMYLGYWDRTGLPEECQYWAVL